MITYKDKKTLTVRENIILATVKHLHQEKGYPPTAKELADHIGLKSPSGIRRHLVSLAEKKWIAKNDFTARGIKVL